MASSTTADVRHFLGRYSESRGRFKQRSVMRFAVVVLALFGLARLQPRIQREAAHGSEHETSTRTWCLFGSFDRLNSGQ